ncbi:hypothetical protein WN51_01378 [Melipona quadrifasciata]|uniref:Uncharacterized protein n=1 Tax=Melipona quadrifasciata TaxID=166423 RepID=A0A0M8ZXA7_9HYME|nr:hypothetical protein WN51_01378 [Melipona quadrifasciata]
MGEMLLALSGYTGYPPLPSKPFCRSNSNASCKSSFSTNLFPRGIVIKMKSGANSEREYNEQAEFRAPKTPDAQFLVLDPDSRVRDDIPKVRAIRGYGIQRSV